MENTELNADINPLDHLPLVSIKLKQLNIPSYLWEEMFQEGAIGLLYAARHYNPKLGFAFSTYATAHIKYSILQALSKYRKNNFPISLSLDSMNLYKIQQRGEYKTKLEKEIAEALSVNDCIPIEGEYIVEEIRELLRGKNKESVWFYLLYTLDEFSCPEIKKYTGTEMSVCTILRKVNKGRNILLSHLRDRYRIVFNHDPIHDLIKELRISAINDSDLLAFVRLCEITQKIPSDNPGFLKVKSRYPNCYRSIILNLYKGKT